MKNLKLILTGALIFVALVSCSDMISDGFKKNEKDVADGHSSNAAYLCVSMKDADYAENVRTVLPEELTISSLNKFVLTGTDSSNAQKQFGEWASYSAMTSATLLCDAGVWNFTLFAYRNNTLMFTGEIQNKTIAAGSNTLSFSMRETPGVSTGTIGVTLYFPAEEQVKAVKAGLFSVGDGGSINGFEPNLLTVQAGAGSYSGKAFVCYNAAAVPAGAYFVEFYFYRDAECQNQIPSLYTEVVQVEGGRTSSAVREIADVEHIYSIEYALDGGSFPSATAVSYSFTKYKTVELCSPERTGYTFAGWYLESGFLTRISEIAAGTARNVKLYAKWIPNTYRIRFDANGGSGAMSEQVFAYDNEQALSENKFTKPGYAFAGWAVSTTDGVSYADKNSILNLSANDGEVITLYAKWMLENNYSITYNLNGGTNADNPADYNVESETITFAAPTRTGYTFAGWYADSGFKTPKPKIEKGSTGNIVLYAKWEIVTYNITYNLDNGTNNASNPASYTVENAITLETPTRTGYTFAGWYEDSGFATKKTQIAKGSVGDVALYAKWRLTDYSIVYNLDGGTNAASNPSMYTVESTSITLAEPTRTGYTFDGWYTDSGFTTKKTEITKGSVGDVVLYAKWNNALGISATIVNSYTDISGITYSSDGNNLNFTAPSGYSNYEWYWDSAKLNNSSNVLQVNLSESFVKGGNHVVLVMVTDSKGLMYSAQYEVTVQK